MYADLGTLKANATELGRVRRSLLVQKQAYDIDVANDNRSRRPPTWIEDHEPDLCEIFSR